MLAARRAEASAWPFFAERLLDAHFASARRRAARSAYRELPKIGYILRCDSNVHLGALKILQERTVDHPLPRSEELGTIKSFQTSRGLSMGL